MALSGVVEKLRAECSETLLTSGRALIWDVLTIRITSPARFAGTTISAEIRLDDVAQRARYSEGGTVEFYATAAALESHRVLLDASSVRND